MAMWRKLVERFTVRRPPEPFPDTDVGRQLAGLYLDFGEVRRGGRHEVRYLRPGDTVTITHESPVPELRRVTSHIAHEGFLLVSGNPVLPHLLSNVRLVYPATTIGCMSQGDVVAIDVNGEAVPLPLVPASPREA